MNNNFFRKDSRQKYWENFLIEAYSIKPCFVALEQLTQVQISRLMFPKNGNPPIVEQKCEENIQVPDASQSIDIYSIDHDSE